MDELVVVPVAPPLLELVELLDALLEVDVPLVEVLEFVVLEV